MDAVKLLGSLLGNNATGGNVLGSLLGGNSTQVSGSGGLGALAGLLGGAAGGGGAGLGALGSLLGSGAAASALGGLIGGGGSSAQGPSKGGIGSLLSGLLGGRKKEQGQASQAQDEATLFLRAMCNSAKADGQVDQDEINNIVGRLGEVDQAEAAFLKSELQSPLDVAGFCSSVPQGLGEQVYAFSVMGMKLDSEREAKYLAEVAQNLRIDSATANGIHSRLGAPEIFNS